MKILHVCTGFNIMFQGGITNYVRNLANIQSRKGDTVFVLTDKKTDDSSYDKELFKVKEISSINGNRDLIKKEDGRLYQDVESFLAEEAFDLIHIHMVLNMDFKTMSLFERYPYIVSLHDYYYICPRVQMIRDGKRCAKASDNCLDCFSIMEEARITRGVFNRVLPNSLKKHLHIRSKRIIQRWRQHFYPMLERAAYLLPVSARVEEIYRQSGIKGNYFVSHIGNVSAESFDSAYRYVPRKEIRAVILSSFSYIKGGQLIYDILRKVDNPNLTVSFYGRSSESEQKRMSEVGIDNRGPYLQKDLPNILKDFDLGIMVPIWEDNGPQVVMEMLNNHVPVLGTRMGGIPDFVNDGNGFLFDPFSDDSIAGAVDFLNGLSSEKIASLKMSIRPTCTPEQHFEEIQKIYESAISFS